MVILLSFFLSVTLTCLLSSYPSSTQIYEFYLISLAGKDLYFVLFWDLMSFLFSVVVILISFIVFVYASYYMDGDFSRLGFLVLLFSFVTSMILLLLSPNLVSMLLGWDGLGMTSYLLVIYYSSYSSSTAGMLTFLINRLGDVFFLLALSFMAYQFDWEKVLSGEFIMCAVLIIALMTKSAQIPFSAWLPAAMAAPTPVSSLVHSSTLVTAGLYIMIRFSYMLKSFNAYILWAGVFTLLAAGLMALFEWDLKKLIAFSTLSQLGFMVSSFAMGLVWLSFFHLLTHALFKASLFLSAGALIHNADNSQEFRNMFLIPLQLFWVSGVVNICLLCLCGIPFTSGFYSKDLLVDGGSFNSLLLVFYLLGVLFTVAYSTRFFLFSHRFFGFHSPYLMSYDKVLALFLPLSVLVMAAIMGGWFFYEGLFSFKILTLVSKGWKCLYFFLLLFFLLLSLFNNKKIMSGYVGNYFFSTIVYLKLFSGSKFWKALFKSQLLIFLKSDQGQLEHIGPQGLFKSMVKVGMMMFSFQSFIFSVYFLFFLLFLFSV